MFQYWNERGQIKVLKFSRSLYACRCWIPLVSCWGCCCHYCIEYDIFPSDMPLLTLNLRPSLALLVAYEPSILNELHVPSMTFIDPGFPIHFSARGEWSPPLVQFFFWFRQLIGYPVWGPLCCGCQGEDSLTFFSGNTLYTLSKVVFHQWSSSVKGRLPAKVIFRRRSSYI